MLDELLGEAGPAVGDGAVADTLDHHQVTVLRLDVAGVAGAHPALGVDRLAGRLLVLEVTAEHPRSPRDDLTDAVFVRVVDADIALPERHPDRVVVDVVGRVDGVGAGQLGLAVDLAQRHPHGEEELEGVGAERRAAGGGRTQSREAEAVLERLEDQPVGEPRGLAGLLEAGDRQADAVAVDELLEAGGVHHPRLHVGRQRFPTPRATA